MKIIKLTIASLSILIITSTAFSTPSKTRVFKCAGKIGNQCGISYSTNQLSDLKKHQQKHGHEGTIKETKEAEEAEEVKKFMDELKDYRPDQGSHIYNKKSNKVEHPDGCNRKECDYK